MKSSGNAVFEYLFRTAPDTPLERLPEDTSLARAVKQHLLHGGHIYETLGVFL